MANNEKRQKQENLGEKLARDIRDGAKHVADLVGVKDPRQAKQPAKVAGRVKLLVSIINHGEGARLNEILDESSISLSMTFAGTGTARSQVLDYLGIGETEKDVLFSLIPEADEDAIIRAIRSQMSLYLVGKGISFTIPLSAVSEIVANGLISAAKEKTIEAGKIMKNENRQYDLIVAALSANYVDDAMTAARIAGAAGGTIIRARSVNNEKAEQFIGLTLTQEQELLLILTKREGKAAIMQALSDKVGLKTPACGVIFSLPVDKTAGVTGEEAQEEKSGEQA